VETQADEPGGGDDATEEERQRGHDSLVLSLRRNWGGEEAVARMKRAFHQNLLVTIQALTEVTLPGPAADGRPSPTLSLCDARRRVSAKADTPHEVPKKDDSNRLNRRTIPIG